MIADTSLFIDLERGNPAAYGVVKTHAAQLHLTWVMIAELRVGQHLQARHGEFVDGLLQRFPVLDLDAQVSDLWAKTYSDLRRAGTPIGVNDLWTAAIALRHGMPVITRNNSEFERVPGLRVVGY